MKRLIAIIYTVLFVAACSGGQEQTTVGGGVASVKVETAVVKRAEHEAIRIFSASVASDTTALIVSKAVGYIDKVPVKPGQSVKKGDVLITIKSRELEEKKTFADSAMNEALSGIEQAKIGFSMAQSQHEQAKTQFALMKKTYDRYKNLLAENSVSQQEYDQVQAQYKAAEESLNSAQQNVELSKEKINQVELKKQQAQAARGEVEAYLSYTTIRSPFDGVVLEKLSDVGNLAAPGQPLLKVGTNESVIHAFVSESLAGKIQVGDAAMVEVPAFDKKFSAVVVEVSYDVDPATRKFQVKLSGGEKFVPGTYVKVAFPVGKEHLLVVPKSALVQRGQLSLVFADVNGIADMRVVKTGREFGDTVEIFSGLAEGEKIVVGNAAVLKAGDTLLK